MDTAAVLLAAMLLDAALGEPRWLWSRLPHPAVLMGRAVDWLDRRLNAGEARRAKGVLAVMALVGGAVATGWAVSSLPLGGLWELLLASILLAQKSLAQHVHDVARALRLSLADGKRAVALIVGRDTAGMDETAVCRAAIESAAENLSDGVIAPVFWFLVAGLPGILIYKVVNTADSMIGYRTERYLDFGRAAARLDDLLNWVPARVTAGLILLAHASPGGWAIVRRDARLHRSPNAGWPESAAAAVLGIALSGPRSYDGAMRDFPWVHPEGRKPLGPDDIDAAVRLLWRVWTAALGVVAIMAVA